MNDGPLRASRPAERRPTSRPEPVRQAEEPQPAPTHQPKASHAASHHVVKEKSSKRFVLPAVIILLIVLICAVGFWFVKGVPGSGGASQIDSGKYQAVFFVNGQVYFGKLHAADGGYLRMTNIFYLQSQANGDSDSSSQNPQNTSDDKQSNNVQLIKLGDEIHGPEDSMMINKDQVLFYENLKSDGKVSQSIAKYNSSH
ncbi:MAG TPA: hypothetical protein VGE34_03865 [Candidatus Saccharimonadales bacterium]